MVKFTVLAQIGCDRCKAVTPLRVIVQGTPYTRNALGMVQNTADAGYSVSRSGAYGHLCSKCVVEVSPVNECGNLVLADNAISAQSEEATVTLAEDSQLKTALNKFKEKQATGK